MRIIDRDDFNALGATGWPYHLTLNEDGTQDLGPFLFCVNDQGAWVGRWVSRGPGHSAFHVAPIDTATVKKDTHWKRAAALWLKDAPITQREMLWRYKIITRELETLGPRTWSLWDDVYHWPEGSTLMWDGLSVHPFITARRTGDTFEVVWTGTSHDQRFREREDDHVGQ